MRIEIPFLIFEATQSCNLNCRYCYNHWKRSGSPPAHPVTYTDARRTLGRLLRSANVRNIAFSGGEPLLLDGVEELVLFCRLKGKTVTVITNGTAAKEGQYRTLVELGVSLFEIPIHSSSATPHDFMTRCAGSWAKAVRSAEQLTRSNIELAAVIVLCGHNIDELSDTLAFIRKLGIRRIMLNRFNVGGAGIREADALMVSPGRLRKAFETADNLAGVLDLEITSNVCTPFCVLNPSRFPRVGFTSCAVGMPHGPLTVDAFGYVRLCNHSPKSLGNIHEDLLARIIACEYAEEWRSTIPHECAACRYAARCRGGCRAAAEQCGLTIHSPDPVVNMREWEETIPFEGKGCAFEP